MWLVDWYCLWRILFPITHSKQIWETFVVSWPFLSFRDGGKFQYCHMVWVIQKAPALVEINKILHLCWGLHPIYVSQLCIIQSVWLVVTKIKKTVWSPVFVIVIAQSSLCTSVIWGKSHFEIAQDVCQQLLLISLVKISEIFSHDSNKKGTS